MRDSDADYLAEVFETKGRIYVKEVGGNLHGSIHIFSRDVMLIDKLARGGLGTVRVIPGGTRDWAWARRTDFRKYLPAIISRMEEGKQKDLLTLLYRSTVAGDRRQDLLRELLASKAVFKGDSKDIGDPDPS